VVRGQKKKKKKKKTNGLGVLSLKVLGGGGRSLKRRGDVRSRVAGNCRKHGSSSKRGGGGGGRKGLYIAWI